MAIAVVIVLVALISLVPGSASDSAGAAASAITVLQIRRLHDFNRTGWWAVLLQGLQIVLGISLLSVTSLQVITVLLELIAIVSIVAIGWIPGTPHENRFGPPSTFRFKTLFRTKA
jgi:uncharacterized membrane protein YhaH (DUF805 family)